MDSEHTDAVSQPEMVEPRAPEAPPLPPAPPREPLRLGMPSTCIAAGMLLLALLAWREEGWKKTQVWGNALVARSGESLWDGTIPIRSRELDAENFPAPGLLREVPPDVFENSVLDMREHIVAVELPEETWSALVESGRPPIAGTREVIAGPLCRFTSFDVAGEEFLVVGKLQHGSAGFAFSYLCRADSATSEMFDDDATSGWLDPQGAVRIETENLSIPDDSEIQMVLPFAPLRPAWSIGALLAQVLVVTGGGIAQWRILKRLRSRHRLVESILFAARDFPRLFIACHVACYGAYFAAAIAALVFPLLNLAAFEFVTEMFTTGDLGHIGRAYVSGNVLAAAWTTFENNFIIQTLRFAIIPSLVIPLFGLAKTAASLAFAGFVLAPIWAGFNGRMIYHSLTLSMEAQAYVLAAFGASAYAVYVIRALFFGKRGDAVKGFYAIAAGTVISAVILVIAAFYEAVTLIFLT